MGKRRIMGQRISRLDGPDKSQGKAKYNSDLNPQGLLLGALLTCPYAHARVKSIDIGPAKSMDGVTAVRAIAQPGAEIQWEGAEIAVVAAVTEEKARDAVRAIKVDWEVLPHIVKEEDLSKVGNRAKPAGETTTGDPDAAAAIERQFKLELRLARQVTHKHVVRIHDLGDIDGIKYITMPYVQGADLASVLKDGVLPVPRTLRYITQIVGGLVPSANAAATAGASSAGVIGGTGMTGTGSTTGIGPMPESRVVSVKPIEGPCPPR